MVDSSSEVRLPEPILAEYPFTPQVFTHAHGQLSYVDEGEGRPVVMLHGNPTWSWFYRRVMTDLRSDYRCLSLDHLGMGLSEKPKGGPYHLAAHRDRFRDWLEHLGIKQFHLIAHDWGGAIGAAFAVREPERLLSLTFMNTAAFPFPHIPWRIGICRIPLLGRFLMTGLNGFARAATRITTVKPLPKDIRKGYLFPYQRFQDRVAIAEFVRDIPIRESHRSYKTLVETGKNLERLRRHPTLLLWGMQDWCFHPRVLAAWQRRFPDAEVVPLEEAGHYLLEDEPEACSRAIKRFLSGVRS